MTTNPILDEIHETRKRLLAESGGTLAGLVAGLQARQRESGRQIIKTQRTKGHIKVADDADSDGESSPAVR